MTIGLLLALFAAALALGAAMHVALYAPTAALPPMWRNMTRYALGMTAVFILLAIAIALAPDMALWWAYVLGLALANIIVWAFGAGWAPRIKAGVGALCALAVFLVGLVMWPEAWPDGPAAFSTLFYALLVVLAAAGAPVFRDVIRGEEMDGMDAMDGAMDEHGRRSGTTGTRTRGRRWEGWNL